MRHTRKDGEPISPDEYAKGIKGLQEQDGDDQTGIDDQKENKDGDNPETPEDKIKMVRDRRDRKDADEDPKTLEEATKKIGEQDKDIQTLLDSIDEIQAKNDLSKENTDGDDDTDDKEVMNADSVDKRIRERVSILRIADRLNLDDVDNLSNLEIKKRVIKKVNPNVRLDGKSKGYIHYAFQYAVENSIPGKKDVNYQRMQMAGKLNHDSADSRPIGLTAAQAARERMIAREGGNQ